MHHLLLPAPQPVKLLGTKADNSFVEPEFYVSKYKECNAEGAWLCVTDVARVKSLFPSCSVYLHFIDVSPILC